MLNEEELKEMVKANSLTTILGLATHHLKSSFEF